jgi:hypothetical protein
MKKRLSANELLNAAARKTQLDRLVADRPGMIVVDGASVGIWLPQHADSTLNRGPHEFLSYARSPEGCAAWEQASLKMHAEQKPVVIETSALRNAHLGKSTKKIIERG